MRSFLFKTDSHSLHYIAYEVFYVVVDGVLQFPILLYLFLFEICFEVAVLGFDLFDSGDETLVEFVETSQLQVELANGCL